LSDCRQRELELCSARAAKAQSVKPQNALGVPPAKAKSKYLRPAEEPWQRILIAVTNPDLQAVVAFTLIGLLLTLNVMFRSPDLGAIIAQYNQF
jgi:hypothetical protein